MPAAPELVPIGKGEVLAEGRGVALLGYGYGCTWRWRRRRSSPTTACRSPSPTRASPSRSTPIWRAPRARHDLLVTIEENVLPAASVAGARAPRGRLRRAAGERARVLRVGLPDRYVTHGRTALLRPRRPHRRVGGRAVLAALPRHSPLLG
jgi:1-deoxy-D-xylulose-5-phosphate synthase